MMNKKTNVEQRMVIEEKDDEAKVLEKMNIERPTSNVEREKGNPEMVKTYSEGTIN